MTTPARDATTEVIRLTDAGASINFPAAAEKGIFGEKS